MMLGTLLCAICGLAATACVMGKEPITPPRPPPVLHIDSSDDVRWPLERTMFVGTIRHTPGPDGKPPLVMLELDEDLGHKPAPRPRLVALKGISEELRVELADQTRALVSGIGHMVAPEEAAVGAVISIGDVQREAELAAPHLTRYALLRRQSDLSIGIANTLVSAEGVVVESTDAGATRYLLRLRSGTHVALLVVACDGEAHAKAQLGQPRHVHGYFSDAHALVGTQRADVAPTLAISMPAFLTEAQAQALARR